MSIETALYSKITSDAGISAIQSDRLFWKELPATKVYPASVYFLVSNFGEYAHSGSVNLYRARLQINLWTKTGAQMRSLSSAYYAALHAQSFISDSVNVNKSTIIDERDISDPGEGIDEHLRILDLDCWYNL